MKGKNYSEKVKNILIVLLVVSAVLLGWESRLFGNSSADLGVFFNLADDRAAGSGNGGAQDVQKKIIGEPRPVGIAVTGSTGVHYGARYFLDEIGLIYNMTVQIFGEALGSAQMPEKADEQAWRAALTSPGIYFEYMTPIQLPILVGWFGEDVTWNWDELSVRRLCVAVDGGKNRLYFQDDSTGTFYAADTAIKTDSITKVTNAYTTDNASFAFEIDSTPPLKDPYALLMPDVSEHPLIEAGNPLNDEDKQIDVLQILKVSEHRKPIIYPDGTREYIENDFTVKISPDGTVGYTWDGSQESSLAPLSESEAVELARRAVSESIGSYCGEAKIYFDAVNAIGGNEYRVMFKYVVAGGWIYTGQDGYAASVTVKNDIISDMKLRFRSYAMPESGEKRKLMPEIQAAAAAGDRFMLCYLDSGNGILEPSWRRPILEFLEKK